MDELTEPVAAPPAYKLYKRHALWVGSYLGGPIVAGYILAENFKAFNEPDKAKKTWIISIIVTIALFSTLFIIPEASLDKVPKYIIPITYSAIAFAVFTQYFGGRVETHETTGGPFYSWGRVIIISLIGLAATFGTAFIIAFFAASATNTGSTNKTYGKLKHEVYFDVGNISETEVDALAASLTKSTFFNDDYKSSILAKKEGDTYVLMIALNDGAWNDTEVITEMQYLRNTLQADFPQNTVVIDLCEDADHVKKRIE